MTSLVVVVSITIGAGQSVRRIRKFYFLDTNIMAHGYGKVKSFVWAGPLWPCVRPAYHFLMSTREQQAISPHDPPAGWLTCEHCGGIARENRVESWPLRDGETWTRELVCHQCRPPAI